MTNIRQYFAKLSIFLRNNGRKAYHKAFSENPNELSGLVIILYNNPQLEKKLSTAINQPIQHGFIPNYHLAKYLVSRSRNFPLVNKINQLNNDEFKKLVFLLINFASRSNDMEDIFNALDQSIMFDYAPEEWHSETLNVQIGGHYEKEYGEDVWPSRKGGDDNRAGPSCEVLGDVWVTDYEQQTRKKVDKPSTLTISCNFENLEQILLPAR